MGFRPLMARAVLGALVSIAVAGISSSAFPQTAPRESIFRPNSDLPGFDEMWGWKQSYMLAPFFRRSGMTITDAERAAILKEWEKTKPLILERHRLAENDPFIVRVDAAHNTVANTNYLAKLKYRVVESTRPFALFVELPGKSNADDDLYLQRVQNAYTPYLRPFLDKLDKELAPLAKNGRKESCYIVWVLASRDSYVEFVKRDELRSTLWVDLAHYSPLTRWAYTYFRYSDGRAQFSDDVQILLHEMVHAYVDGLAPKGIASVKSYWMDEGLAEYLSYWHIGSDGTIQFEPRCSPRIQESLNGVTTPSGELRIKLDEMLAVTDPDQFERLAVDVVNSAGMEPQWIPLVLSRFYADAYLLILWLQETQDGRFKPALRQLITEELGGQGGAAVARKILADALDPSIEEKLSLFARELLAKNPPRSTGSDAAPHGSPSAATARALRFAGVNSLEQFQCIAKLQPAAARAMRWQKFASFGFTRAKECFPDSNATADSDAKLAGVVSAETERLLKRLASGNEEVAINKNDKGRIVAVTDESITLDRGGGKKPVALPRSSLAADKLSFLLRGKGEKNDGVAVSAAVLSVLAGQARPAREIAQRVKKDPSGALEGFLAADGLPAEFDALRTLGLALKQTDANVLFNAVRATWPQVRASQVATCVRDELSALLIERLSPVIPSSEVMQESLHGRIVPAPPGAPTPGVSGRVVNITYDFDDAAAAQDFAARAVPGEMDQRPQPLSELRRQKAQQEAKVQKAWPATGGHLRTVADGYCEFRIPLRGDVDVEVVTILDEDKTRAAATTSAKTSLWFGIRSDDGAELGAVVGQYAFLIARNGAQQTSRQVADDIPIGQPITGRLRLDRRMLSYSRDGGPPVSDPFLFDGTAHLFFYAPGSDSWHIDRLTIRATLNDADLRSLAIDVARARVTAALAGR